MKTLNLLPIDSYFTLSIKSWHPYVKTKGVYEDGWCTQSCILAFKITCEMRLTLLVEFPGWQTVKLQKMKVVGKSTTVHDSLIQGTSKIEIDLFPGDQQVRLNASETFEMPSPDSRRCALRILEVEFSQIE